MAPHNARRRAPHTSAAGSARAGVTTYAPDMAAGEGASAPKPTVRMSEDEAWDLLARSINGILTTLRSDGRPVALPVWFVALDHMIYVQTRGKKIVRARNDSRASFLVEAGERWAELHAVHLDCHAEVIEPDAELRRRISDAMDTKYAAYRTARAAMPSATREHYSNAGQATIALTPQGKLLTWDNRKLSLG